MLDEHPEERPTAAEVVNELSESHEDNVVALGQERSSRPLLVAFMPEGARRPSAAGDGWRTRRQPRGVREIADLLVAANYGARRCCSPRRRRPLCRRRGPRDVKT